MQPSSNNATPCSIYRYKNVFLLALQLLKTKDPGIELSSDVRGGGGVEVDTLSLCLNRFHRLCPPVLLVNDGTPQFNLGGGVVEVL